MEFVRKYGFGITIAVVLILFVGVIAVAVTGYSAFQLGLAQGRVEGFYNAFDAVVGVPFAPKFDYEERYVGYPDLSSLIDRLGTEFGGAWQTEPDTYLIDGMNDEAALLSLPDRGIYVVAYYGKNGWNGILFSRAAFLPTVPAGAELVDVLGEAEDARFYQVDGGLVIELPDDEAPQMTVIGIFTEHSWDLDH